MAIGEQQEGQPDEHDRDRPGGCASNAAHPNGRPLATASRPPRRSWHPRRPSRSPPAAKDPAEPVPRLPVGHQDPITPNGAESQIGTPPLPAFTVWCARLAGENRRSSARARRRPRPAQSRARPAGSAGPRVPVLRLGQPGCMTGTVRPERSGNVTARRWPSADRASKPARSTRAAGRCWDRWRSRRRSRRSPGPGPRARAATIARTRANRVVTGYQTPAAASANAAANPTVTTAALVPPPAVRAAEERARQRETGHRPPQHDVPAPRPAAPEWARSQRPRPLSSRPAASGARPGRRGTRRAGRRRARRSAGSPCAPNMPPRPSPSHHTASAHAIVPAKAARAVARQSSPAASASWTVANIAFHRTTWPRDQPCRHQHRAGHERGLTHPRRRQHHGGKRPGEHERLVLQCGVEQPDQPQGDLQAAPQPGRLAVGHPGQRRPPRLRAGAWPATRAGRTGWRRPPASR